MDELEIQVLDDLEEIHFWYKARKKQLTNWFNEFKHSDLRVLDVGSATGGNTLHISSMGHLVTSIENSDIGIRIQKEKGIRDIQADAQSLPFEDGSFDVVICLDVLEHILDDFKVVKEIYRVLAVDGHYLISVPEDPKLWSVHDVSVNHIRRYTKKDLIDLMSRSELRIDQIWSTLFFLRPIIIVARKFSQGSSLKKMNFFLNRFLYLVCRLELSLPKYRKKGVTLWITGQKKQY